MLFTDGKSNQANIRAATRLARDEGVAIQTLLLGDSKAGATIMEEVAAGSGGRISTSPPSEPRVDIL